MNLFEHNLIRTKLKQVILAGCVLTIALVFAGFFTYERVTYRKLLLNDNDTKAALIAENSNAALVFRDSSDAMRVLGSLSSQSHFKAAAMYDAKQRLFAAYDRAGETAAVPATPGPDGTRFEHDALVTYRPITLKGDRVGTLYLCSDLSGQRERFWSYLEIALCVLVGTLGITYGAATAFANAIAAPIEDLNATVRQVTERRDFSLRAQKKSHDETGNLADSFNEMLQQIQERDAHLQATNEALKDSERRTRSTLDSMMEGCQILSKDWRYLYINDVAESHNRRPKEELLGKVYTDLWPGIETTGAFAAMRQSMELRESRSMENEFTFPDGNKGWFELRVYPVPEGIVILSIDITERKKAEEDLRVSNKRLHDLIDALKELAGIHSLDEIMAVVRTAARRLAGADGATFVLREGDQCYYADEDAIGPLWKGQRFSIHACVSGWAMLNRQTAVIPDIYADPRVPIDAYRPTFVKSLAMVPIRVPDPLGAIGTYWSTNHTTSDLEQQLLQSLADAAAIAVENVNLYHTLEQRVAERTAQLAEANKELEAFSYSVSHDLRAPLRHVDGFAEMLQKHAKAGLDEKGRRYLTTISDSAKQMGTLIDELLVFSRMGRADMQKRTVDLGGLVEDVVASLSSQGTNSVRWDVAPLPAVEADESMMRLVFQNLLDNALKYSRTRPTPEISVGYHQRDEEYQFFVRDNGVGFDPQYAGKLFGVFQRLHRAEEFEGTGIGLANVRRIVVRHGGKTWAESAPDAGATFYFSLPLTRKG